jgi:hypothetical protein
LSEEHLEKKGSDMRQDERVDMVLSEIQSILNELPPIQKTPVEQTKAAAMPTVESESAIPITAHHVLNKKNEPKTSAAAFAQEVEALLGISLDRGSCQWKEVAPDPPLP